MRTIPFEVLKAELAQDLNAGRAENELLVKSGQVGRSNEVLEMEQRESAERLEEIAPLFPLLALYGGLITDILFGVFWTPLIWTTIRLLTRSSARTIRPS
ncbi:hypothetical protein O1L60_31265 [Streptomyces diastatochromogenes]|nr:hypothetical protein [Streptomyces diastatochromogenes]